MTPGRAQIRPPGSFCIRVLYADELRKRAVVRPSTRWPAGFPSSVVSARVSSETSTDGWTGRAMTLISSGSKSCRQAVCSVSSAALCAMAGASASAKSAVSMSLVRIGRNDWKFVASPRTLPINAVYSGRICGNRMTSRMLGLLV